MTVTEKAAFNMLCIGPDGCGRNTTWTSDLRDAQGLMCSGATHVRVCAASRCMGWQPTGHVVGDELIETTRAGQREVSYDPPDARLGWKFVADPGVSAPFHTVGYMSGPGTWKLYRMDPAGRCLFAPMDR